MLRISKASNRIFGRLLPTTTTDNAISVMWFELWSFIIGPITQYSTVSAFSFFLYSPPDILERHVCGPESGTTNKTSSFGRIRQMLFEPGFRIPSGGHYWLHLLFFDVVEKDAEKREFFLNDWAKVFNLISLDGQSTSLKSPILPFSCNFSSSI